MSPVLPNSRRWARSFLITFVVLGFVTLQSACGGGTTSTGNGTGTGSGTSGGSGSPGSGSGSGSGGSGGPGSTTVAFVYVGSGALSGSNAPVTGFTVDSEGMAQLIPGSPFNGVSNSLVTTSRYLFGTDGKTVTTYTRSSDGSLQQTSSIDGTAHNQTPSDSAVSSLSVDRSGQTLYAGELNYDSTGNNAYSYFAIGSSGAVSFLNSSGIDSNYHAPLVFSQDNQFAYGEGCYHLGWELFGFARNSDGTLTSFDPGAALPPNNDPDTMWCPTDSDVSVANYLALAYRDLSQQNGFYYLATYAINSDGTLGLVQGSEVTTPFTGESSVAFDPTGTYLAVAGQAGIQVYQLASNGVLTAVGNVQQPTVAFVEVRWDNDNHLYAISDSGLYIFSSNQGALSLLGSPYSVAGAGSLAVLPQS